MPKRSGSLERIHSALKEWMCETSMGQGAAVSGSFATHVSSSPIVLLELKTQCGSRILVDPPIVWPIVYQPGPWGTKTNKPRGSFYFSNFTNLLTRVGNDLGTLGQPSLVSHIESISPAHKYKVVDDLPLHVDVYPPDLPQIDTDRRDQTVSVPTVVYFHAGGLLVGDRRNTLFPTWLQRRLSALGTVFISADYRLLVPCTGHDILQDIKDLFAFLGHGINKALDAILPVKQIPIFHVNSDAIAVSGESSGGLCACLSVMHASPRPVALLSFYGMVGAYLTDHYLEVKTNPFFFGLELVDPNSVPEYLFPYPTQLPVIAEFQTADHPPDAPRRKLVRLYLQQGEWLDYYTGDHQLSERLRSNPSAESIPPEHTPLFPQFGITSSWPPTFMVHGNNDSAIPIQSSLHLQRLLEANGVQVTMKVVEGQEHLFDHEPDVEDLYGGKDGMFDEAAAFLVAHL